MIRFFALKRDRKYKWKTKTFVLRAGTILFGGKMCMYPALNEYQIVWNHKRFWFKKEFVEGHPRLFEELFTEITQQAKGFNARRTP